MIPKNIVAHPELAAEGQRRIDWVRRNMPILNQLERQFAAERPFAGDRELVAAQMGVGAPSRGWAPFREERGGSFLGGGGVARRGPWA